MAVPSTPPILAIDTVARSCTVAVHDGERLCSSISHEAGRELAERIVDYCAAALREAELEWREIAEIAVVVGPGSFAGMRAGVAAARGLGLSLGIPVQGITTLEAIARGARGREALATFPGPRGLIFAQPFDRRGVPMADAVLGTVEEIGSRWGDSSVVGPASDRLGSEQPPTDLEIDAVALLAWERMRIGERRAAEPFYLRDAVTPPAATRAEGAAA